MPQTSLLAVQQALSRPRFNAYRTATPGETDLDVLARYAWNMRLASSLYSTLQLLEVVFRNTLSAAIAREHGPRWYTSRKVLVDTWARAKVIDAEDRIPDPDAPDAPGRVTAGLDFGFWTSLLNARYELSKKTRPTQVPLWPSVFGAAFPHVNAGHVGAPRGLPYVRARLNRIRLVRNRISHHEPIWQGVRFGSPTIAPTPLPDIHAEIVEAIGWFSPETRAAALLLDEFPTVFTDQLAPLRAALAGLP